MGVNRIAVGERLRALRGKRPLREVAEAVGISVMSLCYYERGEQSPRDPVKVAIAKYYGKSVAQIFFDDEVQ
jgi:transcriptional regulator with XRE-family HTH domain